jgi:serine protease Do
MLRIFVFGSCCLLSSGFLLAAEAIPISAALEAVLARRYPQNVADLRLLEAQVQKVAEQAVAATVEIEVGHNIGSGVIISREGLVLTAAHVIGGQNRAVTLVLADGRRLKGRTLGAHHLLDAGMVQLDEVPDDIPFAPVVSPEKAEGSSLIGQWVVATGQPGGLLENRAPPVRLGRVLAAGGEWICTDCTLVGGDSGGPLFNVRGEVLAIHMSIGPATVHNFHVPVAMIRPHWEKMLAGEVWGRGIGDDEEDGERMVLGIAGREVEDRCVVTQVFPGFPAEKAGIAVGDVIMSLEGEKIDSLVELTRLIVAKEPGDEVELKLLRGGKEMKLDVVLNVLNNPLPGSVDPEESGAGGER